MISQNGHKITSINLQGLLLQIHLAPEFGYSTAYETNTLLKFLNIFCVNVFQGYSLHMRLHCQYIESMMLVVYSNILAVTLTNGRIHWLQQMIFSVD